MLDAKTLKIIRRADIPEGSKPWTQTSSPDGEEVWVQAANGSNAVLDARTLEIKLYAERVGNFPVIVAFSPDGRHGFVSMAGEDYVEVLDAGTGRLVKRLEVGRNNANVSFRPDGKYG